jgi:hypothetical protein
VSPLEERLRRLEDVAAIRTLDATCGRLLDDGDWLTLVAPCPEDGVCNGLSGSMSTGTCSPSSAAWRMPG